MDITQAMEVGHWPRAIASTQAGGGDLLVTELDPQLRDARGSDAFIVKATAQLDPLGEPVTLGVVFDRLHATLFEPSQLDLHVQPNRVHPILFEAAVGEFIDSIGTGELQVNRLNQIPFSSKKFSKRRASPLSEATIHDYLVAKLKSSRRFRQDLTLITLADQLRLGVTIKDIADVARIEEGQLWTFFTEVMGDGFVLRPTNEFLRELREAQRTSMGATAQVNVTSDHESSPLRHLPSSTGVTMQQLKVFISHSSKDQEFVKLLINLLRSALNLPAEQIRCTSIDGYRLPAGASAAEHLRREIHEAEAFIGVISANSLQSLYVAFELGARWGAGRHLIPVLAPGVDYSVLSAPLADLNALQSSSPAQLHQLVTDLAAELHITSSNPAAYQAQIDLIQKL